MLLSPEAPVSRDGLLAALSARRIGTGVHYRGVHLHPYYRDKYQLEPAAVPGGQRHLRPDAEPAAEPKVTEPTRTTWSEALTELLVT